MHGSHSLNYHMFYDPDFTCYHTDKYSIDNAAPCPGPQYGVAPYGYKVKDSPYSHFTGYSTPTGYTPTAEPLYGDALVNVCKETRTNLIRLRETIDNVEPCKQYGVNHWHFNKNKKKEPEVELPEHMRPKWKAENTIFGSRADMRMVDWKRPHSGNTETDDTGPVNKFCYLCTTLDEHQQHIAKRGMQMKAKAKVRQRIDFIVPLPGARAKIKEEDDKKECLYKITVKTGNKPNAATSAKVFVRLKGRDGLMKPQQLTKKTMNYTFGRGTKEMFYIKTPILGELRSLIIYHDGLEKKHSWYLEEIEVCDVAARQEYMFTCRQWLSLHQGDHSIKREIRAEILERFQRQYLISVFTGKKTLAGTDATVNLTLVGKLGASSKLKLSRKVKDHETLQKGATDTFNFVADDIGPLQKIRIEHNNTGRSPDWFLEKIEVEESERMYLFPCGQWIPNDEQQEDVKVSLELYPASRKSKAFVSQEKPSTGDNIDYLVTVITGDVRAAGTDANVYLMMMGKRGKSREVQLDNVNNNFERGMTDEFKINSEDVGHLKKIQIRHDDSSLGPGWFLDKIVIRRFFPKSEIRDKMASEGMDDDEKALRRASMITGETIKGRDIEKAYKKQLRKSKKDDSESDDSDSDDYKKGKKKGRKDKKKDRSGSRGRKEDDSDLDERRKKKKKGKKKKKFTYGGIDTWVTDSDSDSDSESDDNHKKSKKDKQSKKKGSRYDTDSDDDSRRKKKRDKKKKSKYDTDSSDDDSDDKRQKKKDKKKGKYDKDSSDDSDHKNKRKKDKKKKGKYDSSSDDSDDDDWKRSKKDNKKKKSKYDKDDPDDPKGRFRYADEKKKKKSKGETDSDSEEKHKRRKSKKKHKGSDSDSDSEDLGDKFKKWTSKASKKLRFKSSSSDSDSDSSSSSDSDADRKKEKKKRKGSGEEGRRLVGKNSDSEDDTKYKGKLFARWREGRQPYCDEYEFICRRWLATDEDDRQIQRTLKPTAITTFFKKA